jgi:hypothetical protein
MRSLGGRVWNAAKSGHAAFRAPPLSKAWRWRSCSVPALACADQAAVAASCIASCLRLSSHCAAATWISSRSSIRPRGYKTQPDVLNDVNARAASPLKIPQYAMSPYQYPPLRSTSVAGTPSWPTRLLLLKPGNADQPLECEIITVDIINTSAQCEALSYVCGPDILIDSMSMRCHDTEETPTMPTRCRDGGVPIRLNLLHALKAIRYSKTHRLIWIDALCINQSDPEERGRQVRHMRQIYKHANRIIVWLGTPDEAKLAAFCNARDLCDYRKKLQDIMLGDSGRNEGDLAGNTIVEESTHARLQENPAILASLVELFEDEYFRRVWCVQEVVAAKQCTAQCGSETMDFCKLLPLIKHAQFLPPALSLSPNPLKIWTFVNMTRKRVATGSTQGDRAIGPILHVLTALRDPDSTDDRDRLYAALGICDEGVSDTTSTLSGTPGISLLQRGALLALE